MMHGQKNIKSDWVSEGLALYHIFLYSTKKNTVK